MQRLEVSGAVRHIYRSLGFKGLIWWTREISRCSDDITTQFMIPK